VLEDAEYLYIVMEFANGGLPPPRLGGLAHLGPPWEATSSISSGQGCSPRTGPGICSGNWWTPLGAHPRDGAGGELGHTTGRPLAHTLCPLAGTVIPMGWCTETSRPRTALSQTTPTSSSRVIDPPPLVQPRPDCVCAWADFGGSTMYNAAGFGRERVVGKSFYMAPEVWLSPYFGCGVSPLPHSLADSFAV
jgi:hypothetical protein